jgi:hypothetical protein
MKNLHILPTDKPSRYVTNYMEQGMQFHNIYITTDEEIKEGDWIYDAYVKKVIICVGELFLIKHTKQYKKIILTTDQDLIANGIEEISEDELLKIIKDLNNV